MIRLTLAKIAASFGIVLPDEMLARLNVGQGDALYATEMPDGGYHLTSLDRDFGAKMDRAGAIVGRYRIVLHTLAEGPDG